MKEKTKKYVGIVEDDTLLNQALRIAMQNAGYVPVCAYTVKEALTLFDGQECLFLIDIGLPDGDGIHLYQELRKRWKTPAIFLTARDEEKDMLSAFEVGAEDYVVKPFSMKVLLKRIEVVLRRNDEMQALTYRELSLNPEKRRAVLNGKELQLTAKEYQLLEYLMRNQGQILTKEMLLEHVWGVEGQFVVDNTLSVTINRLRRKIEPESKESVYIKNVFGLGYRMGE